jgi:hypothetical protein
MTNALLSDRDAGLVSELLAPSLIGGTRRPVKVVEHPAFAPRRLRAEAMHAAFTVVRLPVVTLDPLPRIPDRYLMPAACAMQVA